MTTPLLKSVKATGKKIAIEFASVVKIDNLSLQGFSFFQTDGNPLGIQPTAFSLSAANTVPTTNTDTALPAANSVPATDADTVLPAANSVLTIDADTALPKDFQLIYDSITGGITTANGISIGPFQAVAQSVDNNFPLADGYTGILIDGSVGSLLGGASPVSLIGNGANNLLEAGDGNDTLSGGSGADSLSGGLGNDTYIVDNADDIIIEAAETDVDSVYASATYTLGDNLEKLTLTGAANINATGNELDNTIVGNTGNNLLDDGGGGEDTLVGGKGNDTYIINNSNSQIIENSGEGIDSVVSSTDFNLNENAKYAENLTYSGSGDFIGTGNSLGNVITGADGQDELDGRAGADTLAGAGGDDTYIVDNTGDKVIELADAGADLVKASVSYKLGDNVENLTLVGEKDINATGNTLDNTLTGNDFANVLDGGAGSDVLIGGDGNDTYVVDSSNDVVIEEDGKGIDLVKSSSSFDLSTNAENVENLTLTGTGNIAAYGNSDANVLTGNLGNNLLHDGGGGEDTLAGGKGNDTYLVNNSADKIIEFKGEGNDTVVSTQDFDLSVQGLNVENLTLNGSGGLTGTGNELNNILASLGGDHELIGGKGNDTYIVDSFGDIVTEEIDSIGGNDTVVSSVDYAIADGVENLTLAGTATIGTGNNLSNILTGNAVDNTLYGGDGNDILDGGAGDDVLSGGDGNDTYVVDSSNDIVIEEDGKGIDLVKSSVTFDLSEALDNGTLRGAHVENLTLVGTENIDATGNDGSNILIGNDGNNSLDGGGTDGIADILSGGKGDDTYIVYDGLDTINEKAREGTDTLEYKGSASSYTLSSNLENLIYYGSDNFAGTGNSLANLITGGSGNDVLDGKFGGDTLVGGDGADTYYVDNIGDIVLELDGEGADTIISSVNYTLGNNLENLTLVGGSKSINATGNTLDNIIIGNDGNNLLSDGAGGEDTLVGGKGNDTYVVNNSNDVITEQLNEGADLVKASVSFNLSDDISGGGTLRGGNVENLTLTGTGNIDATGTTDKNILTGNTGDNVLNDGGMGGIDRLVGGKGNDTYVISNLDVIIEKVGEGTDTILSSIDYNLNSAANVENLTLAEGFGEINAIGNKLDNVLTGNESNNILDGGAGLDVLFGGLGADTFRFTNTSTDRIGDFSSGEDRIEIKAGILNKSWSASSYDANDPAQFRSVTGSVDLAAALNDPAVKFVFEQGTGNLYANVNGSSAGSGLRTGPIATLDKINGQAVDLKASDIQLT
jgi:trimeric autotransporter adhesin